MTTKKIIPFPDVQAGEDPVDYWERCKKIRVDAGAGAEFEDTSEDITDQMLGQSEATFIPL
jgi:hypothetical protein